MEIEGTVYVDADSVEGRPDKLDLLNRVEVDGDLDVIGLNAVTMAFASRETAWRCTDDECGDVLDDDARDSHHEHWHKNVGAEELPEIEAVPFPVESLVRSAGIAVDADNDEVIVMIALNDQPGHFRMGVRRFVDDTGATRVLLSVPHADSAGVNVRLKQVGPGVFEVG